jgi:hypothetical protein
MIILLVICLIVLLSIIVQFRHCFWNKRNVFHVYDILSYFVSSGVMVHDLPLKTKYCNFKNITSFQELTDMQYGRMIKFIRRCYLKNNENQFLPESMHIIPYFKSHNSSCWFSFYEKPISYINNKDDTIIEKKEIFAIITTRPVHIYFKNKTKYIPDELLSHYADYLCVDNKCRKQGLAQEMIETQSYNHQHTMKKATTYLFKREGTMNAGIVPLTSYNTYCFDMLLWHSPEQFPSYYSFIKCDKSNISIFYNFWKTHENLFEVRILTELSNLIDLLDENIIIYMLKDSRNETNNIIAVYFFRVSRTFITKGAQILTCFATISNCKDNAVFIHGFKLSVMQICNQLKNQLFQYLAVENLSHTDKIVKNLLEKSNPIFTSLTAYYFVNFIHHTVKSANIIVIN